MSEVIQYRRVCDRCAHPFAEAQFTSVSEIPPVIKTPLLIEFQAAEVKVAWDDLCPDCQKVVVGLIDRIRLVTPKQGSKKKKVKDEPAPEPEAGPSVVEEVVSDAPAELSDEEIEKTPEPEAPHIEEASTQETSDNEFTTDTNTTKATDSEHPF